MKPKSISEIRFEVQNKFPKHLPHLLKRTEQLRLDLCYQIFQSKSIKHQYLNHLSQQSMLAEAFKASLGEEQYLLYARSWS